MRSGSRRHEAIVVFTHEASRGDAVKTIMHVLNNYGPLEMSHSKGHKTHGASKNRVELEPGDEGLRASPAPGGFVSSTYDVSSSFRRPRKTPTHLLQNVFF